MPLPPSSLRLTGATILRDGALQQRSVAIEDGVISRGPLPEVDLRGYYVLPGVIDLHGDAFERHLAPRPTAPFPPLGALRSTDRDAAANGIATAWMAHSWSWEGGHRSPDAAERFMRAVDTYRSHALTDLRVQIRCETHTVDTMDRLIAAVRRHKIDYVIFNDHIDEARQMAQIDPARLAHWAHQAGRSPEAHMQAINDAEKQSRDVPRFLCRMAEAFDTLGITYGSHDDGDGETREMYSMIGAKICEFPTRRAAAALANAVGDPILMGAPNVVRGGSQSGNIAARDLIEAGLCNALVSDYYYPALTLAAFKLVDDGLMGLARAWAMISEHPAEILRLADRGVIDYGRRADLVVIHQQTRAIEATISAGRITHLAGEAAHRFMGARDHLRLAAE
jgi:alpha-D-ribose 1-methylphosphonate 5-triphosphate diphosphatase